MFHWLLILLLLLPSAQIALAERFVPPHETFASFEDLRNLRKDLPTADPVEIARRIDALLAQHADEFAPADEHGLVSVSTFIAALPPEQLGPARREYRRLFDGEARTAFEAARQDSSTSPEALHAMAKRYALSSIASQADVEAGDRSLRLGDGSSAGVYYALAMQSGWKIDAAREAAITMRPSGGYEGQLPSEQIWYGRPESVGMPMYFPLAAAGLTFFAGPKHVLAFKETGQIAWKWSASDSWAKMFPPERQGRGRGTPYAPAMFFSPAGASILVVRQPRAAGRDFLLRALRASDGKVLWSSDENSSLEKISIASSPAVAGRFIYVSAVDFTDASAHLTVLSLDLLDGHTIFKTTLGILPDMRTARQDVRGWDGFWEQSEPLVSGDAVYLAPNVGVAFSVDRFNGKLSWTRVYDESGKVLGDAPKRNEPAHAEAPPADRGQLLRYRGTPAAGGESLVIAPQDSPQTWALDRATGRVTWKKSSSPDNTLIGAAAQIAVFTGPGLRGLDAATGKERWTWSPPGGTWITGPPVMDGEVVIVPTTRSGVITLSALTGHAAAAPAIPSLRQVISSEAARRALEEAAIAHTLAAPPAPMR